MDTRSKAQHLLVAFAFLCFAMALKVFVLNNNHQFIVKSEPLASPWDQRAYRLLTQGEWVTGLDLLWLRALQDPRIDHVKKGEHPWNFYDYDLITDFDTAYGEIYYHGAMSLVVIRDDVSGGLHLLEKANKFRKEKLPYLPPQYHLDFWKEGWLLPLRLAYVYLFEYDDLPSAMKYYKETAELLGSPPYLQSLKKRFEQKDGVYIVGLRLLRAMYTNAATEEIKEKLGRRLAVLEFKFQSKQWTDSWAIARKKKQSPNDFALKNNIPSHDPFGGKIVLTSEGIWTTESKLEKVLGL
ncbi:MAG: hypothetical protein KA715_13330 [Xanthomonadaceae bacterium]|nr:hypothetical protein [Xanthomonadaceae bacterium]